MSLSPRVFEFLLALSENNHRDWFNAHKDWYQEAHASVIELADALLEEMNKHDHLETETGKKSLFRIYRDVRFRKDKRPYKEHWAGGFRRATAKLRGGYYFHLAPGNSFIAGGFWGPNKEDLLRIRQEIAADAEELREIITAPEFAATFGGLQGDQLKTAPKGFSREHPDVDLLRYKQFIVQHDFSDADVHTEEFPEMASTAFQAMRPWLNYMSEVLTTDANGVSLI
ncbi:MAG: DUF2461 domain-containing protein [Bacteroidota bacterium]